MRNSNLTRGQIMSMDLQDLKDSLEWIGVDHPARFLVEYRIAELSNKKADEIMPVVRRTPVKKQIAFGRR